MLVTEAVILVSRYITKTFTLHSKNNGLYSCYVGNFNSFSTLIDQSNIKETDSNDRSSYLHFSNACDTTTKESIKRDMNVIENFLRDDEENSLLAELEPYMKRLRYEFDHWDDAIHGYRETERLKWNENNTNIIHRVRNLAFPNVSKTLSLVHVLDLAEEGYIKPHIDSVRFCGSIIAGLSLLSDSVMRLVHDKDKEKYIDILLKRKSLYIMKNSARYDYTHEILANKMSHFNDIPVKKTRRISVICRNEPDNKS